MKLYELSQSYVRLQEMAEELDPQIFLDTLDSIKEGFDDKAENTAKLIRSWEAEVEALKAEEKRIADRRKSLEGRISTTKQYLQIQMEMAGIEKVKRPLVTISIRNNPPSVKVLDESLIPSEYMIPQLPKVSKKDIKEALKNGEFVPGAELQSTKGLVIK